MTKKPTEQKDDGEPAFSPDGRYLYWSEDTTPGKIFEYNKDPNGADLRHQAARPRDRQDRRLRRRARAARSARRRRPTASRSPSSAASATSRRSSSRTSSPGIERPIWDGLERDMQETWAIHGVYPGMAWTPDSKRVVFWAGGKIRSADLAGEPGRRDPVPRPDTRRTATAVRFGVDVLTGVMQALALSPKSTVPRRRTFPVRMLRWVAVSPDGKRVAYQALGYVYVRDLPDGTPQPPDDADGPLRVLPVLVARRQVPRLHDLERRHARLDPHRRRRDGRLAASSRTSPATTSSPSSRPTARGSSTARGPAATCARRPGPPIPASTRSRRPAAKSTLIVEDGFAPRFGKASDRVFFVKTEGGGDQIAPEKRILASIKLDGSDVHEYYLSELADRVRDLARRQVARLPRGLQRLRHAVRRDRHAASTSARRARPCPSRRSRRTPARTCTSRATRARLYWSFGPAALRART